MSTFPAAPTTPLLTPADPGWDDARRAWNLAVDQHPAAQAYERLRRIKAEVDPADMIRANHPIPPALPELDATPVRNPALLQSAG